MRKVLLIAAVLLLGLMPATASAQAPLQPVQPRQEVPNPVPQVEEFDWFYPLIVGTGAILGVLAVNFLAQGYVGVVPGPGGLAGVGPIADSSDFALSRFYAIVGAVVGGWVANWLYFGA